MPATRRHQEPDGQSTRRRGQNDDQADFCSACEHAAMLLHYRELIEKAAGTAGIGKLAVYAERQRRSMGQALTMISVSKGKALEEAWGLWQDTADEAHQQISLLAHYMGHPHATHELSYG